MVQPLDPPRRRSQEVLGRSQHQVCSADHGQGEQPHQTHVVVQRQPRDDHVGVGVEASSGGRGVEVGQDRAVGKHDPLGVGGRPAGELEDGQGVGVRRRGFEVAGRAPARGPGGLVESDEGGIPGRRVEEGGQIGVDEDQGGVRALDPRPGLGDELLHRPQPHRQGQHHRGRPRQPGGLDGGDELSRGGAQEGDVPARPYPPGLQDGGHGAGLLVELGPGEHVGLARTHEGDGPAPPGGDLHPGGQCVRRARARLFRPHNGSDPGPPPAVTRRC